VPEGHRDVYHLGLDAAATGSDWEDEIVAYRGAA
jgi:hypothetical protein